MQRLLQVISGQFQIEVFVTDRHRSVAKWMRENMNQVKHLFDIWHVAKSENQFFSYFWSVLWWVDIPVAPQFSYLLISTHKE